MGQIRHGSATTTHAVRAAIQRSQATNAALSREDERVIAGFEDIQRFAEQSGHPPRHGEDKDIFERLYAVRLERLVAKPQINVIRLYLKVDPSTVSMEAGYTRDVSSVGHFGTGDLEVTVSSPEDFERAKDLIVRSYDAS